MGRENRAKRAGLYLGCVRAGSTVHHDDSASLPGCTLSHPQPQAAASPTDGRGAAEPPILVHPVPRRGTLRWGHFLGAPRCQAAVEAFTHSGLGGSPDIPKAHPTLQVGNVELRRAKKVPEAMASPGF